MNRRNIGLAAVGMIAIFALTIEWIIGRGGPPASDLPNVLTFDEGREENSQNDEEKSIVDSGVLPTTQNQLVTTSSAAPNRLMWLRERAEAGEGLAQYEFANELSGCSQVMQRNSDPMTITDKVAREFVQMCRSFGKSSDEFRAEAEAWEERLERDEVPSAVAMKVIRSLDEEPDDDAISQARAIVAPLLTSGDPYVYMAAGVLSETATGDPAMATAWHLLACENNNDSTLCGRHGPELSWLCNKGYDCGEMTIADYYYLRVPEDYDEALGIAMVLREKIENGRYGEIWE